MSFVYFIGCNWGTTGDLRVKIGFTRRHPSARADDFQPGSPEVLDVLCYTPGDYQLERKFHETFASCRLHGEWFSPFGLMERFIRRLMSDGRGARFVTEWAVVEKAFFEEVYDWAPTPEADEDPMLLIESAETDPWDDDFAHILAERLKRIRELRKLEGQTVQ